jgi:hypothetical protein
MGNGNPHGKEPGRVKERDWTRPWTQRSRSANNLRGDGGFGLHCAGKLKKLFWPQAVLQLQLSETTTAEWIFPQEKSTLHQDK